MIKKHPLGTVFEVVPPDYSWCSDNGVSIHTVKPGRTALMYNGQFVLEYTEAHFIGTQVIWLGTTERATAALKSSIFRDAEQKHWGAYFLYKVANNNGSDSPDVPYVLATFFRYSLQALIPSGMLKETGRVLDIRNIPKHGRSYYVGTVLDDDPGRLLGDRLKSRYESTTALVESIRRNVPSLHNITSMASYIEAVLSLQLKPLFSISATEGGTSMGFGTNKFMCRCGCAYTARYMAKKIVEYTTLNSTGKYSMKCDNCGSIYILRMKDGALQLNHSIKNASMDTEVEVALDTEDVFPEEQDPEDNDEDDEDMDDDYDEDWDEEYEEEENDDP